MMTSQMRRDRARLKAVQAKLLATETQLAATRARLHQMEAHPVRVAVGRARGLMHGLGSLLRPSRNEPASQPAREPPAETAIIVRGSALIIDDHWPQPTRDSGSLDIVNLAQSLSLLGFEVILAAAREHTADSPARELLVRSGIRCLTTSEAPSVEDFLVARGGTLDLCILCRVYCGGRFLEQVLSDAPQARVIFNSVDLAHVREERHARLTQDAARLAAAATVREREEAIIRASDATIVVSRTELDLLAQDIPEALVAELPLARPLSPPVSPFARRHGIGFIGGFAHTPNAEAVRYFLSDIWPIVLRDLPGLEMTIVGADFPQEILAGVPGRVCALGHLADVGPWFEGLRLTVAPLTFGAGAKGKVASSLAAGVPCIATPIAVEGMMLRPQGGVLVAPTAEAFAACLSQAYTDEPLWNRLSAAGQDYAASHLSLEAWRERLDTLLRQMGL